MRASVPVSTSAGSPCDKCPVLRYSVLVPDLAALDQLALVALLAFSVAVAGWANARIARLFTEDDITVRLRAWVIRHLRTNHLLARWIQCPWCLGWWTAWPITAVAWFPVAGLRWWWLYLLAGWAVAHAGGHLNHNHGS